MLLTLLACLLADTPPAPGAAEREALQQWERDEVRRSLDQAILERSLIQATELCIQARRIGLPEADQGCRSLHEALDEHGSDEQRMKAHALLYDAATTPAARQQARKAVNEAAVRHRYSSQRRNATLASHRDVTPEMRVLAVRTLLREFARPLDEAELAQAARARLALLLELLSAGEAPQLQPPLDAALEALVEAGVAAGLPPTTLDAELTEAVFSAADPHTLPVWPAEIAGWNARHAGAHPGRLGIHFDRRDAHIEVVGLDPTGPAWSGGVHIGDHLLRIGELDITALPPEGDLERVASAMGGPDGTTVEIVLERGGEHIDLTLARATLLERTVRGFRGDDTRLDDTTDFVRIVSFRPHTDEQFAELELDRPRLILDLRGNIGGDIEAALAILDGFQADGPMMQVEGQVLPQLGEGWNLASEGGPYESKRAIAVLVDHQTASSAEILAGGLQTMGAILVGTRTAGKGSGQVLRVDDQVGMGLQFTNLYWKLGDGSSIHRGPNAETWGIEPDVTAPLTPTERYAVGVLQARREAPERYPDGTEAPYTGPTLGDAVPAFTRDPQIDAALEALSRSAR